MIPLTDSFNRVHDYLRVSLTDKCNLKCIYCAPIYTAVKKLNSKQILSYEELLRLIAIFVRDLGFKKIRLTGGEPFVREGSFDFVNSLSALKNTFPFQLSVTTNGTLIHGKLAHLKAAGIDSLNISLDSLSDKKIEAITGVAVLPDIVSSIEEAIEAGYQKLKINVVIIRNVNDDELSDFVDFAIKYDVNIRFIEFMPFTANGWSQESFMSYKEMKNIIEQKYKLIPLDNDNLKIAKDYQISSKPGLISFISSMSEHFCSGCSRLRITAEGIMKLCLFSQAGENFNLKNMLRDDSVSDSDIAASIRQNMQYKKQEHPDMQTLMSFEKNIMTSIGG